jgi:AmiR/NasT family two-component response regulator
MVAAVAGGRARREPALNEQPQLALNSRVTIEQAKGVLAQYGGLELAAAFDELRHYARSHNVKLADLAHRVVDKDVDLAEIIAARQPPHPPQ